MSMGWRIVAMTMVVAVASGGWAATPPSKGGQSGGKSQPSQPSQPTQPSQSSQVQPSQPSAPDESTPSAPRKPRSPVVAPVQPSVPLPPADPVPPKPRPEPALVFPLIPPRPAPVVTTTVVKTQTVTATSSVIETRTVWLTNPNGSRTSVTLKSADGGMWVGPKGEYYNTFPTEEQLLPVYGLPIKKEAAEAAAETAVEAAVEVPRTIWLTNPNGSRTPVELKPAGGGTWQGPKGEIYDKMPTEDQLLPVYGLK